MTDIDWQSRMMPPLTLSELEDIIFKRPNFKAYVVFANEDDDRWALARAVEGFLGVVVRSYLILPEGQVKIRATYNVLPHEVGFVFSRDGSEHTALSSAATEDFMTVIDSVNEA